MKHINLKCRDRLTLAEARALLAIVPDDAAGPLARAAEKLARAARLADHVCEFKHLTGPAFDGRSSAVRYCTICAKGEGIERRYIPPAFKERWKGKAAAGEAPAAPIPAPKPEPRDVLKFPGAGE